jgi:hypothetical protein
MERNEVEINKAKLNGVNSAQAMVEKLVWLGIPEAEISDAIEHLKHEAETKAIFELSKRKGKELAGE